jgi:putative transposase
MTLYKNKYRIESARFPKWDYTSNAYYFITICTHERQCFFGEMIDSNMIVSPVGEILAAEWQKTEQIRPYVQLDVWVIMPNHFHGILIINNPPVETTRRVVSTTDGKNDDMSSRLKTKSLGSIIGQFKSVCTKQIWELGFNEFRWQAGFHDHIIRDEAGLNHIREYILNNPTKWELDKHNPRNFLDKKPDH